MKTLVVLTVIITVCFGLPSFPKKFKIDNKVVLERTEKIHRLLRYVNQPTYFKDFIETANKFEHEKNLKHQHEEFLHLPKGKIFSVFNENHLKYSIELFKWFYNSENFDEFYEKAVWSRLNVNEGVFIYSFKLALVHKWCTMCIIPPTYETNPYYFFDSEIIQKAQTFKQIHGYETSTEGYTIISNYSEDTNIYSDQKLSYFTEDIGLNTFYYDYHIWNPFWLDEKEFKLSKNRRGELFSFVHQQLLARFYLERLSNGFGKIENIHFEYPIKAGFYPSLRYPNGLQFPFRAHRVELGRYWEHDPSHYDNFTNAYVHILDFSKRIRDAIDIGHVVKSDGTIVSLRDKNGLEILTDILEGNPNSPNIDFYGNLQLYFRHLLEFTYLPTHRRIETPSAFEHFETTLRDPISWQFFKWLIGFIHEYETHLPSYTKKELELEDVTIDSVEVDRLITYFDYLVADLSQSVACNKTECVGDTLKIKVKQERLNHKPFGFKINVFSKKPIDVIGKVFIGPKYDQHQRKIDLNKNRENFFLIDKFYYSLKEGHNVVERSCKNNYFVSDKTSSYDIYKQVLTSIKTGNEFIIDGSEVTWGFPNRLLLPKGSENGQHLQFYIIFYEHKHNTVKPQEHHHTTIGSEIWDDDTKTLGYPFDRVIDNHTFNVTNSFFKDVIVYHKNYRDLNTTH